MPKDTKEEKIANATKNIERGLERGTPIDKYVNQLSKLGGLDALVIKIGEEKYTLLMYFAYHNNLIQVRKLLSGEYPSRRTITNAVGESALFIAVFAACKSLNYDTKIIDALLEKEAEEQVVLATKVQDTPLFIATEHKRVDLVHKLAAVKNKQQFLMLSRKGVATPLFYAAEKGLDSVVDELLYHYPNDQVLQPNIHGTFPIDIALFKAHKIIADKLLKHSPQEQLTQREKDHANGLHNAINSGDLELVTWLVNAFPFVLASRSIGNMTALLMATRAKKFNINMVRYLLKDKGEAKQVCTPDSLGFIPLYSAVKEEIMELLDELLKYQPDEQLLHPEPEGYNPLSTACYFGKAKALNLLMIKGSKSIIKNLLLQPTDEKYIPLHVAAANPAKVANYPAEIINSLLIEIPNEQLRARDRYGRTALNIAVAENNVSVVEKLVTYDDKIQFLMPEEDGSFPLCHAAQNGYIKIVKSLLTRYAAEQMNTEVNGWRPIHVACQLGSLPVVSLIQTSDAKQLSVGNIDGMCSLHLATYFKHKFLVEALLLKFGVSRMVRDKMNFLPFHLACQTGDIATIELLLKEAALEQLFATSIHSALGIHTATQSNQLGVINFLIKKFPEHAKKLVNSKDKDDFTCLHIASLYGFSGMVEELVTAKADGNARDNTLKTPLHAACYKDVTSTINLLINKADSKVDAVDYLQMTPLHLACQNGHAQVVETLLKFSANVNARDKYQRTPLLCAVIWGHHKLIRLLPNNKADVVSSFIYEDQVVTALRLAIENLDLDMVEQLIAYGADPRTELRDGTEKFTVFDIVNEFDEKEIKEKFLLALNVSLKAQAPSSANRIETIVSDQPKINKGVKPRSYLKSMGFTDDELVEFEENKKQKKSQLKQQLSKSAIDKSAKAVSYTWLNGKTSHDNPQIFNIEGDSNNSYCYLDRELLAKQGCELESLAELRFKFGHKHIKKLDNAKGEYSDWVCYEEGQQPVLVKYTHELKISKLDRILLFGFASDKNDACLYLGCRFVAGGLHSTAKIASVRTSGSLRSMPLAIKLPTVPVADSSIKDNKQQENGEHKTTSSRNFGQVLPSPPPSKTNTINASAAPAVTGSKQDKKSDEAKVPKAAMASTPFNSKINSPVMAAGNAHDLLLKRIQPILDAHPGDFSPFADAIHEKKYAKALRRACTVRNRDALSLIKIICEYKEILSININEQAGSENRNALHHSAVKGNKEVYDFLITQGVDISLVDKDGKTAKQLLMDVSPSFQR